MPELEYTAEFWRWYFKRYTDIETKPNNNIIEKVKNVFNGQKDDLNIDLEKEIATWEDQQKSLLDYLTLYHQAPSVDFIEGQLSSALSEYKQLLKAGKEDRFVYRDKTMCWAKQEGYTSRMVTNFNIVFESIIKIYNADKRAWERNYEFFIEFEKNGQKVTSGTFQLQPSDCLTTKNFQAAIWDIGFRQTWFKSDSELQWFFTFLENYYRPREVSQYDHFGFITYERRKYYLARNVLVKIPVDKREHMVLVAPDEQNCFLVEGDRYIQLDPSLEPAPYFELGPVDAKTGLYQEDMKTLMSIGDFKYNFLQIQDVLNDMIAGQVKGIKEGDLVLAYVFSFLFFEEIYKRFAHIIFLYLFGRASVGKGKLAEIILSFFGIPITDKMTYPTKAALENNLASHSQIPVWIDEFKPELGGSRAPIPDQLFNSWFELSVRNISRYGNRKKNENKITRAMIMFNSNYLPETDHLNSRLLRIEYSVAKRGDEEHYYYLSGKRKLLQQLFLSALQFYHIFDRPFYSDLLIVYKRKLKESVNRLLHKKKEQSGLSFNLEDRQIEQMAALCTTWLMIRENGSNISFIKRDFEELQNAKEQRDRDMARERFDIALETGLFLYGIQFLVNNAQQVGMTDPLSEFLNVIGYLVDDHTINAKHFSWTTEGDLKLWFSGIWTAYEKFKNHTATNKAIIRGMIAGLSDTPNGSTQNWQPSEMNRPVRKFGYRLKNICKDKRFAYAFNWEDPNEGMYPEENENS